MIVLGIESATQQVSCAIGGQEGILGAFQTNKGKRHAEVLAPAIEFTCRQTNIDYAEISVIAVDIGPGLFTGLRVGVATAKAMAQALRVPMIGMTSLDLLAFPARWSDRLIVPVVDARRGELFYSFYRQVAGGVQRIGELTVGSPDALTADLIASGEGALLVGDGAIRYADVLAKAGDFEVATTSHAHPSATALVELAHQQALREQWVQPWDLKPLYLRKADAEISWETRNGPWRDTA